MTQRDILKTALTAALLSLALFALAFVLALTGNPVVGQEQFETISAPAAYTASLVGGASGLRRILFVDGLFMLAYTVAIGFAIMAFAERNRVAAWIGGIGIVLVMLLDAMENAVMAQSLDLALIGEAVSADRIAFQALVSAMKWQSAAAALLAVSFVLPDETPVEKLLVWGVRLGLPIAVPLFIMNGFDARGLGLLMLPVAMGGGFVLLALVLLGRLRGTG